MKRFSLAKKKKQKSHTSTEGIKPKDKKYGFLTSQKKCLAKHGVTITKRHSKSTNQNLLTFTNLEYLLDFFQRSTWHRC